MKIKNLKKKINSGAISQIFWNLSWNKKFLPNLLLYTVISWLALALSMSATVNIGSIVDELIAMDIAKLLPVIILYILLSLGNIALSMVQRRIGSSISYKVYRDNSAKVYRKIMYSDWEQLSRRHTGDLIARLSSDVEILSNDALSWIPVLLTEGVKAIIAVCVIAYHDITILLVLVAVAPIVFFMSRLFVGRMYTHQAKLRELNSEITSFEDDSFRNMQMIKSFDLAGKFSERMQEYANKCHDIGLVVNRYEILSWCTMFISGKLAAGICAGWVIFRVYQGVISVGTMTMLAIMAGYVSEAFRQIIQLVPSVVGTVTSTERIRVLMEMDEEEYPDKEACDKLFDESLEKGVTVELENVSFTYANGKNIFNNANIMAKPNEIIALVGPSGEGKTTMLRILLGLVKIKGGHASIYGENDRNKGIAISPSTRNFISYVPQGNTMMAGTIAENMRVVNQDATDDEIIEALKSACAYDFVSKLEDGLNHKIGEGGSGFSEGQNQRLAIARALICKTPILLLDEATSALDVGTERKVLENIMQKDGVRTCILTTHRPTVLSMCDRVYRINNCCVDIVDEAGIIALQNDF